MSNYTRVAAVTGSNRGLGFEFVKQLSSEPSTLVVAFTRSQTESLEKLGRENIKIVKMDAANPESIAVSRKRGLDRHLVADSPAPLRVPPRRPRRSLAARLIS